jgi:hypothetical protein
MQKMNKILAGHQYVANFLDAPVRIGMIFRMDDKQFIPAMHFNDAFPGIDLKKWIDTGTKGIIKFSATKEVALTFGSSATTGIGQSEVKLKFQKAKSAAGAIQDAAIENLRYGNVLPQLKQMWQDQGYVHFRKEYVFVYDVVTAGSGTLVYSEEGKNEVVLKHALGEKVTKIADLGSGNFEYVSNTKRTLEIIRPVAHRPLFKAFTLKANWQPEVLG